jgi:hypothetical protein
MNKPIRKDDPRSMDAQLDAVVECVKADGCLSQDDLQSFRKSIALFQSRMCAHSGWETKYLLQGVERVVTSLNTMHADSGRKLISAELSQSLLNLIHNGLAIGEYEGPEDPTVQWRQW